MNLPWDEGKKVRTPAETEQAEPCVADEASEPIYIARIVTIGALNQERLPLEGLKAWWILEGDLALEGGEDDDVGFRVEAPGNHTLADLGRVSGRRSFRLFIPEDGSYSMVLDNRTSYLNARKVHLTCAAHCLADSRYWERTLLERRHTEQDAPLEQGRGSAIPSGTVTPWSTP